MSTLELRPGMEVLWGGQRRGARPARQLRAMRLGAAEALSVYRSTLKYRLKRIRKVLGRDPNDGSARLDLHLATTVWLQLDSLRRTAQAWPDRRLL